MPGSAPVLSLAVSERGFLAGTADGLWASPNGWEWVVHPRFSRGRVVVAGEGGLAYAASAASVSRIETSRTARRLARSPVVPSAIAPDSRTADVYLATGNGRFYRVVPAGAVEAVEEEGSAPEEVLALDESSGRLLAGGLVSGLWESTDSGRSWKRILKTSLTAILIDPEKPSRILIGTAGGILISEDSGSTWRFSEMRSPISGLSARRGDFFAIAERRVFRSAGGDRGWRVLSPR